MPCINCGESAKDKHGGVCVGLSYDEDGNAEYWCLNCVTDVLKENINE